MPPGTRSSTRSKAIPRLAIKQAASFLQELPKREKENLSMSEAISEMADAVRAVLAKGYSYNEIADMLSDKLGISVSAWSLRRYIPVGTGRGKRGKAAGANATSKRGRKKKEDKLDVRGTATQTLITPSIVQKPAAPIIETPAKAAPAPTRRRTAARGKTTADAKPESTAKPTAKTRTSRSQTVATQKPAVSKPQASAKPTQSRRRKS